VTNPSEHTVAFAQTSADAEILLTLPVEADWLALARTTCAAVAARADFTYDEIADLRLAIDEICLSLIERSGESGRIELLYSLADDAIRVDATIVTTTLSVVPIREGSGNEFSERILEALVDDHGAGLSDGRPHAWMLKHRASK
jgi:serine/threonine-protein kinase RsbW